MVTYGSKPNYQYPASRLTLIRGKWHVIVSIPAQIRHLYGNTQRDKRISTGTTDRGIAERQLHDLSKRIYDELDLKQSQYLARHNVATDTFAIDAIYGLAAAFNHKPIPDLKPSTSYDQLKAFKTSCDVYAKMIMNAANPEEAKALGEILSSSPSPLELVEKFKELQVNSPYSTKQKGLAGRYMTSMVHTYWNDLLIVAAREQGLPEHRPEEFDGMQTPLAVIEGQIHVDHTLTRRLTNQPVEPISRPARIVPAGLITVTTVMNEYLADMLLKQKVVDTKKKLTRWNKQFLDVMGDMEIAEIEPRHGYEYVRKVLAKHPTRSNQTLKDYLWGVQNLLKYCVECGYIRSNPFRDIDLKKYGAEPKQTYPYSKEELKLIFSHHWDNQDRLLLSIVATTGMRPSEAGNLTWERFNDTEHQGIRYFSTLDSETERVRTKNQASKREVPLHPDLVLPEQSSGRLFDYTKDEDGRCSTSIAHIINPILDKIVPHPNKSVRSFRRTFKQMMRDAGVEEEVHDEITGHKGASTSRSNYGGMGLEVRFKAISSLDVSFLNQS